MSAGSPSIDFRGGCVAGAHSFNDNACQPPCSSCGSMVDLWCSSEYPPCSRLVTTLSRRHYHGVHTMYTPCTPHVDRDPHGVYMVCTRCVHRGSTVETRDAGRRYGRDGLRKALNHRTLARAGARTLVRSSARSGTSQGPCRSAWPFARLLRTEVRAPMRVGRMFTPTRPANLA